jgi:hypothetical protein
VRWGLRPALQECQQLHFFAVASETLYSCFWIFPNLAQVERCTGGSHSAFSLPELFEPGSGGVNGTTARASQRLTPVLRDIYSTYCAWLPNLFWLKHPEQKVPLIDRTTIRRCTASFLLHQAVNIKQNQPELIYICIYIYVYIHTYIYAHATPQDDRCFRPSKEWHFCKEHGSLKHALVLSCGVSWGKDALYFFW